MIPSEVVSSTSMPPTFPIEVAEFLLELSIGVHRHAMYPAGHPSLRPMASSLHSRLEHLLDARDDLRIGVLRSSFVCDDRESDPGHPVLSELAARFHSHEIAVVGFRAGVDAGELRGLLARLAPEVDRGAQALGVGLANDDPEWDHIAIEPLHYEELGLDEVGSEEWEGRVDDLWSSLVRSAMGPGIEPHGAGVSEALAASIAEGLDDPLQVRLVAGYLAPLVDALGRVGEERLRGVREGVSDFVHSLGDEGRAALLAGGGDAEWRHSLLGAASRSLDLQALLDLLDSAAAASGQTISTSMTRLLAKLAAHGRSDDPSTGRRADGAVRENVRALLRDWTLDDPNPEGYSRVLDDLARRGQTRDDTVFDENTTDVAERILTISVETGHWTRRGDDALRTLLDAGCLDRVYALTDALSDSPVTARILRKIREPAWVRRAVASDMIEVEALHRLAVAAGAPAIPALMDGLVAARTRAARRAIFDTLVALGDQTIPEIVARLPSPYWYVTRNLLNLLALIPGRSPIDPMVYFDHHDPRVRRAALPVAARDPTLIERALLRAISDRDERLAQLGLLRVRRSLTPAVVEVIISHVVLAGRSPELRLLGIRTLADDRSRTVRDALLEVVVRVLAAPPARSRDGVPLAVAALDRLRVDWGGTPEVAAVAREARLSAHAAIRAAAMVS